MQPEQWDQLKNDIHNKCVAYDYIDASDKTLSEFIVDLIQVGRTVEEVNNELLQLIGSDYDSNVTQWMFERKQALEHPETITAAPLRNQVEENQQQQQQQQQEQELEQPSAERENTEKPKSRIFSQALGSVLNNDKRSLTQSTHSYQSRRDSDRYRDRHHRDRSRSPDRRFSRVDRYERSPSRERRSGDRDEDRRGDVFSRIGNTRKEDRPSVFDRLGISKPQIEKDETKTNTKTERCKYWPACKNGDDCIYFHPTTVCPDFPNCPKKATECMFVHPEASIKQPVMMQQSAMMTKLPIPCKFFPYCSNPMCPYMHPMMAPQQAYFMQSQSSFGNTGVRGQIPCKNGDACTRPNCYFLHPRDPNPFADIVCKYDGVCTRPNCLYKHTKENNNSKNKTFVNKKEKNTTERQFSVPEDQVEERIIVGESADLINGQQQTSNMDNNANSSVTTTTNNA
ncbi:MAG: hypothetical protein EXX96DRAFT_563761 [Benjaminiella poitrasii]|nr:MAG: hypothetical protein EXX96DRAFT_563761 [Benjaminiella poitrasii]